VCSVVEFIVILLLRCDQYITFPLHPLHTLLYYLVIVVVVIVVVIDVLLVHCYLTHVIYVTRCGVVPVAPLLRFTLPYVVTITLRFIVVTLPLRCYALRCCCCSVVVTLRV